MGSRGDCPLELPGHSLDGGGAARLRDAVSRSLEGRSHPVRAVRRGDQRLTLRNMPVDVTGLPFNRLIGLEAGGPEDQFLVSLPGLPQYTNHLGTVHASALLAVAEAGSGAFLVRHLGDPAGY